MFLEFLKLYTDAVLPKANGKDAMALDLCAVRDTIIVPGKPTLVNTGIVLAPSSYSKTIGQQLSLRSGFANKSGCWLTNGVGLIEPSFAGFELDNEVYGISCSIMSIDGYKVSAGDRIAQLLVYGSEGEVLVPNRDFSVDWASEHVLTTDRDYWYSHVGPGANGRGGFGSTGA